MGTRFSAPVQTGSGAHPASCTMGTGSFQGVKSGRGVTLTPHPLLVPWPGKNTAIPLLPLWVVRPVQSLSACTGVHYTFFTYYKVKCFSQLRGLCLHCDQKQLQNIFNKRSILWIFVFLLSYNEKLWGPRKPRRNLE